MLSSPARSTVCINFRSMSSPPRGTRWRRSQEPRAPRFAHCRSPRLPPGRSTRWYWRGRPAFHAFNASAAALRAAHTGVVSGKRADLRAASKAHEEALEAVAKAALAILRDAGQPATDATKQAILTTLRALPASSDPPGRLTQVLQPTGFELLAGLPAAPAVTARSAPAASKISNGAAVPKPKDAAQTKALAKAKEAVAAAVRAERAADEKARREEFEAARATREAERAVNALGKAREALETAQEAVETAEREAEAATRKKDAAARRVRETADALAAAKVRTQAAQAAFQTGSGHGNRKCRMPSSSMKSDPSVQRIPWRKIGLVLGGAAIVAWAVGFLVGLLVRFAFGR